MISGFFCPINFTERNRWFHITSTKGLHRFSDKKQQQQNKQKTKQQQNPPISTVTMYIEV